VSQGQIPENIDSTEVTDPRINKILVQTGTAGSGAEADRLVKSHAVRYVSYGNDAAPSAADLQLFTSPTQKLAPGTHIINAGKRWKKVIVK
jgi:hypothetical protein